MIFNFGSFSSVFPFPAFSPVRLSSLKPAEFTELTKTIFFAPNVPENKGTLIQAILMNLLCLMNSSGNNFYLSVSSVISVISVRDNLYALCSML